MALFTLILSNSGNREFTYWTKCDGQSYTPIVLTSKDINIINKSCNINTGNYDECDKVLSKYMSRSCKNTDIKYTQIPTCLFFCNGLDFDCDRTARLNKLSGKK